MDTFKHPFRLKSWNTDLILVVERERLYVSKHVLGLVSPVFEKMFEAQFKEKYQDTIEMPEKKLHDFVEFLCSIYPNIFKPVTATNVCQILPLAHEYRTEDLLKRCEHNLIGQINATSGEDIFRHLAIANLYQLEALEKKCIELGSSQLCANIKNWSREQNVADDHVIKVVFKALELKQMSALTLREQVDNLERQNEELKKEKAKLVEANRVLDNAVGDLKKKLYGYNWYMF